MKHSLPPRLASAVHAGVADWTQTGKTVRLSARDKTPGTDAVEDKWLGWLDIPDLQLEQRKRFEGVASQVRSKGCRHTLLLGAGRSSLCPGVLSITFGPQDRTFVYVRFTPDPDASQNDAVAELGRAGHPVIRIKAAQARGDLRSSRRGGVARCGFTCRRM